MLIKNKKGVKIMKLENLQKELYKKKFTISEYFKKAFETLKIIINENRLWTIFFVIANIWKLLSTSLSSKLIESSEYSVYKFLMFVPNIVTTIYIGVFCIILFIKIGNRIENKPYNFNLKGITKKYLSIIAVFVVVYLIFSEMLVKILIVIYAVWWMGGEFAMSLHLSYELFFVIFGIVVVIMLLAVFSMIVFFISNILYLVQIYCIRNISIQEAFRLNLELSRGNRQRILIPVMLLTVLNFLLTSPFSNILVLTPLNFLRFTPLYAIFPVSVIIGVISSLLVILIIIISVIIYLNVEYDYIKKHNKN